MTNTYEELHAFNDFLSTSEITEGGCAVYQATDDHYYLVTVVNAASGPLFLINDRFFYDYAKKYRDTKPWKLIYVKHEGNEKERKKEGI